MKVTVAMSLTAEQLQKIQAVVPEWTVEKRSVHRLRHEDIVDSDIIVGTVPTEILHDLPKLKLLQLDFAGSDRYAALPIFHGADAPVLHDTDAPILHGVNAQTSPGAGTPILANASGAFGVTISEHMIAAILTLIRGFLQYHDNGREHKWSRDIVPSMISGSRCLVLGLGDIGSNFAMRMHALGSTVTAIKRTPLKDPTQCPPYVESVHTMDVLDSLLPYADFVALCLPNSPATTKVINARTLSLMKPSAVLVNVGRGSAVDTEALAEALRKRRIYGAALDVTDPEPLPQDHPIWDAPGCLITPHISGLSIQPDPERKILDIVCRNLQNFRDGLTIENEVDVETGYRKRK